jgi:hypothetical protein
LSKAGAPFRRCFFRSLRPSVDEEIFSRLQFLRLFDLFHRSRAHGNALARIDSSRGHWKSRVGSTKRDVLRSSNVAVGIRPYLARRGDHNNPIQIGFWTIVQHQVGEALAFGRVHGDRRIELDHRNLLRSVPKFRPLPVNALRNICIREFDTSNEDISQIRYQTHRRVAHARAATRSIRSSLISEFFCHC